MRHWPKPAAVIVALCLVLAAGIGIPQQLGYAEFPRSPFQDAGAFLSSHLQANDLVLHDNKLSYFPMRYYLPDLPEKFLGDAPGTPNDTFAPASQAGAHVIPPFRIPKSRSPPISPLYR